MGGWCSIACDWRARVHLWFTELLHHPPLGKKQTRSGIENQSWYPKLSGMQGLDVEMMDYQDSLSGWWQLKYFWNFHSYLGKMNPFWRAYFSKGLVQPPISCWFTVDSDFSRTAAMKVGKLMNPKIQHIRRTKICISRCAMIGAIIPKWSIPGWGRWNQYLFSVACRSLRFHAWAVCNVKFLMISAQCHFSQITDMFFTKWSNGESPYKSDIRPYLIYVYIYTVHCIRYTVHISFCTCIFLVQLFNVISTWCSLQQLILLVRSKSQIRWISLVLSLWQVATTNPSKTPFLTDNYWKAGAANT